MNKNCVQKYYKQYFAQKKNCVLIYFLLVCKKGSEPEKKPDFQIGFGFQFFGFEFGFRSDKSEIQA